MTPELWTSALEEHWLHQLRGGEEVLMLETTTLLDIGTMAGIDFSSPTDARDDFLAAFEEYSLRRRTSHPWYPEPLSDSEPPRFLLLIAIQVLAASRMADDPKGKYTERAYYRQLEQLLDRRALGNNFSQELGDDHQCLWRERLEQWTEKYDVAVTIPPDHAGSGKHVSLPKSQVVFRRHDLARLPLFFEKCRYKPGNEYELTRISGDLTRHCGDSKVFSGWARSRLEDISLAAIATRQVMRTLAEWDGTWKFTRVKRQPRSSHDKWWLAIARKQCEVRVWQGKEFQNASPTEFEEFGKGIRAEMEKARTCGRFPAILLRYDPNDLIYEQVGFLEAGDRALVAIDSGFNVGDTLDSFASILHKERFDPRDAKTPVSTALQCFLTPDIRDADFIGKLPNRTTINRGQGSFILISFNVVDPLPSLSAVHDIWLSILRTPRPGLIPTGGLRHGRRDEWLPGAGPGIRIRGRRCPSTIRINGNAVRVKGRLFRHELLSSSGSHHVDATIDGLEAECLVQVSNPESFDDPCDDGDRWHITDGWPEWRDAHADDASPWLLGQHLSQLASLRESIDPQSEVIRRLIGFPVQTSEIDYSHLNHPLLSWLRMQAVDVNETVISDSQ